MNTPRNERAAYGLRRMSKAIDRAIAAKTDLEKERAFRWVTRWALVGGICPTSRDQPHWKID